MALVPVIYVVAISVSGGWHRVQDRILALKHKLMERMGAP